MNQKLGRRKRRQQSGESRQRVDPAPVTLPMMYHGGNRGLRVGDSILPAEETGRSNTAGVAPEDIYRKDRVYVTEHLQDAKLFAAKNNDDPVVYVVEPAGELEPDADNKNPGRSFACTSAKIVAVQEISAREIQQARNAVNQAIERAKAANR